MIRQTELSRRLLAIADLVSPGMRAADIGTDHAYVPVWLVQTGRSPEAIAMDVNEGPLQHARAAIRRAGLEKKIQVRLSDGLEKLAPGEADSIVIAGMGGALTIRILKDGADKLKEVKELILGPQSEVADVRRYLRRNGFRICREKMVLEDGKYYALIKAIPDSDMVLLQENEQTAEIQLREDLYGPCLLKDADPVLHSFLEKELRVREQIFEQLKNSLGASERAQEVAAQAQRIRQILNNWP